MKHLKTFEPQIGDYVICNDNFHEVKDFIGNNIGQYIKYDRSPTYLHCNYVIKYENVPEEIHYFFDDNCERSMKREEIIEYNKNKEMLELILASNKYNL